MTTTTPTGRRIAQPPRDVEGEGRLTFDYLNQLVRDLEINFLDTQAIEVTTQVIVTSVNNSITVVAANVEQLSAAITSVSEDTSVNTAAITSINAFTSVLEDRISTVSGALTSSVSVLNSRITSVNETAGSFSAIILRNGAGALITHSSVAIRLQDGRDLII